MKQSRRVLWILGTTLVLIVSAPAQDNSSSPATLTPQDYIDIEQLAARYIYAVENCTNGGYEDVYVRTPEGWRFKSRIHVFPKIQESVQFGSGGDGQ